MLEQIVTVLSHFWNPNNWFGVIFYAAVFFVVAVVLSRLIRIGTKRVLLRENNELVDRTVVLFLTQLAQISVYVVGLIIFFHIVPALNKLGTALLTGVSVMSVVFGLAAQNTLSNLVAGCTLLLYRPFHIDDLIQVATPTGTEYGIVERLTLGYTMLRTLDDRLVIVPNSLMASQVSLNLNRRSLHAMAIVPIGVSDIGHIADVRNALLDKARANPKIHKIINCQSQILEDGGAVLSLRAWCASDTLAKEVEKEISAAVRQHFRDQKIIFPELPEPHVGQNQIGKAA
jgi:small conductance mechanosensitive channel